MDDTVWIGILSALSALAGGGLAQWGAMRAARIQAETTERREALQWERQKSDKQAAARAAKGEEFLGWVLLAEGRMLDRLVHRPSAVPAAESPASAARQAYAVALLYLDAVRPLAKEFYLATAQMQTAIDEGDAEKIREWTGAWRKSLSTIEDAVAESARI